MDPNICQALCSVVLQNSEPLGAFLAEVALGLGFAVTTALAFVQRIRLRRAEAMRSDAERKKAEAEAAAQEAAAALVTVTADRDHWREQSMRPFPRPPAAPRELTEDFGEGQGLEVISEPPGAGLEGGELSEDGTRYAELPGSSADRPVQFDEPPTDPGKRKPG